MVAGSPSPVSPPCQPSFPPAPATVLPRAASAADPIVQRLVQENTALREAWHETTSRILRLEDEQRGFFDEGVFDLVNAVCNQQSGRSGQQSGRSGSGPVLAPTSGQQPPIVHALSPEAGAARSRTTELERSAKLSGENEELRLELARASEVGETLERQQQVAEERMLALEQERAWLIDQLGRLTAEQGENGTGPLTPYGNGRLAAASMTPEHRMASTEQEVRRQLEDMNRLLREELQAASRQSQELLSASHADEDPTVSSVDAQQVHGMDVSELHFLSNGAGEHVFPEGPEEISPLQTAILGEPVVAEDARLFLATAFDPTENPTVNTGTSRRGSYDFDDPISPVQTQVSVALGFDFGAENAAGLLPLDQVLDECF